MRDKKTVFVLGAGASCPYGYPSGARLRELICYEEGFLNNYLDYLRRHDIYKSSNRKRREVKQFITAFNDAHIKSIDVFMANNPNLASIGKYIIAYEIFRAEQNSRFGEEAKREQERLEDLQKSRSNKRYLWGNAGFQGGDWYFYLYNRLIEGLIGREALPDFSDYKLSFITFNYDRSLEKFFYESLSNLFSEVSEDRKVEILNQLKILHVYGQVAPLKWQNPDDYVEYKQQIDESLLQSSANNIRTIYEEKENPELKEAQNIIKKAEDIFFLGFGYAKENMEVLGLPELIPPKCQVYGTAFNSIKEEVDLLYSKLHSKRTRDNNIYMQPTYTLIRDVDCLMLLRKYLR